MVVLMTGEIWGSGHQVALLLMVAVIYSVGRCIYEIVSFLLRTANPDSRAFAEAESNPSDGDRAKNKS